MIKILILHLVAAANLSLGFFIFFRDRNSKVHRWYLGLAVAITAWSLTLAYAFYFGGNIYSHFSQKIGCITGFFIALFFLLFAREFLYPVKFISNFFIITYLIIIGFFVYLVFFTQLFVLDTFMKEGIIYTTFDSFWYIIWATMLSIPFIVGLFILQKKLRASDGVIRRRLYIMLSFVLVAVMGGMLFDVILVYWNNYQFDYIAPVFSIFLMYPMAHMIFISKR